MLFSSKPSSNQGFERMSSESVFLRVAERTRRARTSRALQIARASKMAKEDKTRNATSTWSLELRPRQIAKTVENHECVVLGQYNLLE